MFYAMYKARSAAEHFISHKTRNTNALNCLKTTHFPSQFFKPILYVYLQRNFQNKCVQAEKRLSFYANEHEIYQVLKLLYNCDFPCVF